MADWSLSRILSGLHDDIQQRLATARATFAHPGTKGDASERVWRDLLQRYLPRRYQVETAHIVDSLGKFSDQIDVVVFDRQYSPFVFKFEEQIIVPAESVYAVFEAKQTVDAELVRYAQGKISSVRKLHRTSLPIPHAGGTYPPKTLPHIFGGLLAFESEWRPALGSSLADSLTCDVESRIDIGCIAAHGMFTFDAETGYNVLAGGKPATAFLLELTALLQSSATVPMIDVRAYAKWLAT